MKFSCLYTHVLISCSSKTSSIVCSIVTRNMESDYDDDEIDDYRRPSVLPVASFDDYDPSKPPASGEEYLRRVQLEAQKCPEVAVAKLDVDSFRSQQTETISEINGFVPAKAQQRISIKKQDEIVAYFTSLRMRVNSMKTIKPPDGVSGSKYPPINDHQAWRNYIMGDEDDGAQRNPNHESHPPHLSLLLRLDQVDHHKLLKYLVKWMEDEGFDETIGLWIFSILACIEKPIHSDVYATLREISRALSIARKEGDLEESDVKSINIIICIIGRYFDQKDMVDE